MGLPGRMPGCARRDGLAGPRTQSMPQDAAAIDSNKFSSEQLLLLLRGSGVLAAVASLVFCL